MTISTQTILRNRILNTLPVDCYDRIAPHLESVQMLFRQNIYQPYEEIKYIYFPEDSVISVVNNLDNGSCLEIGMIGNDGLAGAETILCERIFRHEATVQLAGFGYRLKVRHFQVFFETEKDFANRVRRHIYSFIGQISQNQACHGFHTIDERYARWLLMCDDRAERDELSLTQEGIAEMLGVHRSSMARYAFMLQKRGIIRYGRGKLTILDRSRLMQTSCECYKAICRISDFPKS